MNHDFRFVAQHRVNEHIELEYRCRCQKSFRARDFADYTQVTDIMNHSTPCFGAPNAPHIALQVLSAPHDAGRLWLRR